MAEVLKVAVVTPIPTPYRDPFWNALAQRADIDLTVYYCAASKADRPWTADWAMAYRNEVLPGRNLAPRRGGGQSVYWNPLIRKRLREGRFDAVVVGGYNHPTLLAAIREARRRRIPFFMMNESRLDQPRRAWKRWLKERLLRRLLGSAAGGFPTGRKAADYLAHYGIPPERQALVPNAPHVVALRERAVARRARRDALRAAAGIPLSAPVAVFVGRLILKKGAHELLAALAHPAAPADLHLLVVGDGVERAALEQQSRDTGLAPRVHFVGFAEPADVPRYYAAADLFVLPSAETWGVVVLEALASGLPVLVSDQVGCHPDAVTSPAVGAVLPKGDTAAWAQALATWSADRPSPEAIEEGWSATFATLRYPVIAERMAALLHRAAVSR
jgi:glycosyltransferase involved in cell wall biosynthesis